ncbi:ATPase family AAA domain-containing protein 2 isoform X2 [Tympanuchus pallidicinctus]|uniref:ATPase family AAA domain-containing protein 2 isoform X2 n=1 Tax=Tympanuchus pallidicinctus TaxID=109042 RepID=UPI002287195F|nr:ATPase family AAA domain-containing protein 2 isoform X2 [Tympanuchus pallidicinctus]
MVVLRSSGARRGPPFAIMDSSSEFISLQPTALSSRRTWTRSQSSSSAAGSKGMERRGRSARFSSGKMECFHGHCLRPIRKNITVHSDSSFETSMEILSENVNRTHFGRQLTKTKSDLKKEEYKEVTRTLKMRADAKAVKQIHEENGDLEVRRSRYTATNQSILFDALITNTAEAVLQKMDDMEKMRRRHKKGLEDFGVFSNAEENLDMYSCEKKEIGGGDVPDNQQELEVASSEEIEGKEDGGAEDNQKRYELRQRKTVVPYQAPLERPRQRKILFPGPRKRPNRCLPVNLEENELKGVRKDRVKIGKSLADVDPMQIDSSVRFDAVGGLCDHIAALKEMVVFPLLYPEVFERFKIQPPRGCLFYGPPGTGKTLVARALANECSQGNRRVAFFMRKGADCLSKWVGESERQLRLLFDQAYRMRPSIIFLDEIDGLAPVRSSKQDQIHSSIVSTLLALMDGLDSRGEVAVIGATNRLDAIDPALRRPGRFDREFFFGLPNKEARKEIFKIHTRDWTPKLLDTFIDELATECVGYCGADIKSLCAEAALCALRRRYPQIYSSSEKLQLDVNSIKIKAEDFMMAMEKTVPASRRAVPSPGRALSPIMAPLLGNTLSRILQALQRVFPHAELTLKKDQQQGNLNPFLKDDAFDRNYESPSIFEENVTDTTIRRPQEKFLDFSRKTYWQPTSCRPHLLLVGKAGYGQASHLAPAVLHALEMFPVHTLDMSVLFVNTSSPEEACAQLIREAQRTAPSIIYIPHIHLWWDSVGATLKATFLSLIRNIPTFAPVLLLATSDVCHTALPTEVQTLFNSDFGEVFNIQSPSEDERKHFFEDLILNQAAKPPASRRKAAGQTLEVLPVAPPPEPRPLTEEEMKCLEEQEKNTLRELRIFLRDVTHRLAVDRRFKAFTKPVDPEEVPDYDTVIKHPMDLSTVLSKIDLHQYLTAGDFLEDIDLICSNALEYNPDKDPADRLIRHRAYSLKDTAYSIVKEEIDEDLEQRCEEIKESRKKRGCSSSEYAPDFYTVMPKENSAPGCKKTDAEGSDKTKMTVTPVDASTPVSKEVSKRKRKKTDSSFSIAKRRRSFQFNKENTIPKDDPNERDGEDFLASYISNMDQTEFESSQASTWEESETVLQERQTNSNENKAGSEKERGGGLFDMDTSAGEKESVGLPGHSDPRRESGVCQKPDSSEKQEANDPCVIPVTGARCSQTEQRHMDVMTESAIVVMVDYCELKQLLDMVTNLTKEADIFYFEKLYAKICQCIYQHRDDYDKTELLKVMKKEFKALARM